MASLEFVSYLPRRPEVVNEQIHWVSSTAKKIARLPQICWAAGNTWAEANLWSLEQATSRKKIATVQRSMYHLLAFANWLESTGTKWWHFPARESERCLYRFRGDLIRARDEGAIKPGTASQQMAAVVRFYRWLKASGLLSSEWPMWSERLIGLKVTDRFGFEHTLRIASTDLTIPNRKTSGALKLEDGVMPVSLESMTSILEVSDAEASTELSLMLRLGFLSGLRIGSIIDLKVSTLENSLSTGKSNGWYGLELGPAARPPVATKFGRSGTVPILEELLHTLLDYATSPRRLRRQAKADDIHRDLLFLTRCGKPYKSETSKAIDVEMSRLRKTAISKGKASFKGFYFHRSRATFATELMRVCLRHMSQEVALEFVCAALLHKDVETSLHYIHFIHATKLMAEASDAFSKAFMGLATKDDSE